MSTATVEVGGPSAPGLYLSASQIQKFTSCENKWVLTKTSPVNNFAGSEATDLGTLLHTLMGAWWSGRSWRAEWLLAVAEYVSAGVDEIAHRLGADGEIEETASGWAAPKFATRALPIMRAWVEVHGTHPTKDPDPEWASTEIVALELPFDLPIPGVPGARVRGFIDGLVSTRVDDVRTHDVTRLLEFKSMGRWGRENQVPFDPQLHLYLWAARQMFNVQGAVFEAISTYDYKTGDADRRFKRLSLDYDQRAVDATMANVAKIARRGKQLLKNPGLAIRNVGDACTYCDFRRQCLTPWEESWV